jgi:hypothetical protein
MNSHEQQQLKEVSQRISEINAAISAAQSNNGDKQQIAAKIAELKKERAKAIENGKQILQAAEAMAARRARQSKQQHRSQGKYIG